MAEHVSPVSRGRKLEIYWKPIAVLVDPKIFASPLPRRRRCRPVAAKSKQSIYKKMKGPVTKSPSQLAIVNLNEAFAKTLRIDKDRSEHSSSTSGSSVSFSTSMEKIHPALHRADYTEEERAATWYNMLELKSIKIERRQIVRQMENGENVDCSRGLESKTRQGCRMRQRAIIQAISAVLDEQEEQIIRCSSDPEALAQVYSMYTQDSQKLAVERALQDQQETPILSQLS